MTNIEFIVVLLTMSLSLNLVLSWGYNYQKKSHGKFLDTCIKLIESAEIVKCKANEDCINGKDICCHYCKNESACVESGNACHLDINKCTGGEG